MDTLFSRAVVATLIAVVGLAPSTTSAQEVGAIPMPAVNAHV
jgi:hypothetical protein